jgi:uncharacterized Zn finger protein
MENDMYTKTEERVRVITTQNQLQHSYHVTIPTDVILVTGASLDSDHKLFVYRAQKKAEREEELRRSYEQSKMEKLSKYYGVNLYIKEVR